VILSWCFHIVDCLSVQKLVAVIPKDFWRETPGGAAEPEVSMDKIGC